jgi:shikimate dehydrogenase
MKTLPIAGVIGFPIAHSKSPVLHGHWLRRYGIHGHYIPLRIAPEHFSHHVRVLPEMGFVGVNVTIPYKEVALALADEVTDTARKIGAANTLTFLEDGRINADNTDAYGFYHNIKQQRPTWAASAGPAAILGAGGASRAVIVALLEHGAPEIRLTNRTRARAEQLASEFGAKVKIVEWDDATTLLNGAAMLVNTTSLGMSGAEALALDLGALSPETLVTDIVYSPLQTPLLVAAAEIGCPVVDGLGMLLHQAAPGFARWFGQTPDVDDALRGAVLLA